MPRSFRVSRVKIDEEKVHIIYGAASRTPAAPGLEKKLEQNEVDAMKTF
jgi:hypothetical protein